MTDTVRAAGGIVERNGAILLVHRPKYDDWTFPKGKANEDETDEECALREVHEETGLRCELEDELTTVSYRDARNRPKTVRYWRMRAVGGDLRPAYEVDEARWVPLDEADGRLSYERDRRVLRSLAQR